MAKNVIHISDADAEKSFHKLLEIVREGTEFVIEHDGVPIAVLRPYGLPAINRPRFEDRDVAS